MRDTLQSEFKVEAKVWSPYPDGRSGLFPDSGSCPMPAFKLPNDVDQQGSTPKLTRARSAADRVRQQPR